MNTRRAVKFFPAGLAALAVLLTGATALAQQTQPAPPPPSDTGIGFGISGGWVRSDFSVENLDIFQPSNGWMAGIWFGGNRDGTFGFMGEINYVTKGAEVEGGEKIKVSYLQIPAMFRINAGSRSRNGVVGYGVFGGSVDLKLDESGSFDLIGDYNGFDLGVIAGAGIEITRIGFEVRGEWGLLSIYDPSEGAEVIGDVKNVTVQMLIKLRIN